MQDVMGKVTVNNEVFLNLATKAVLRVEGVTRFGSTLAEMITAFLKRSSQGISVEVGTTEIAFDIRLVVDYGSNLVTVANNVQKEVMKELEYLTGYIVKEVNVYFVDIHFIDTPVPVLQQGLK